MEVVVEEVSEVVAEEQPSEVVEIFTDNSLRGEAELSADKENQESIPPPLTTPVIKKQIKVSERYTNFNLI
jgi:hypothetical protein